MAKLKRKKDTTMRTLEELGLGENEAILYSHLLIKQKSTVQELSAFTPFPRTMLYYVLKQLMGRGLVSTRQDSWRTVYIAEDPEKLYELLAEKEREFAKSANTILTLIPKLKIRHRLKGARPQVRTFDGMEEYSKALEDIMISRPKMICAFEIMAEKKPALEVREEHERRRIVRKMKKRVLFFESNDALRLLRQRRYDDFTEFRSIPEHVTVPFRTDLILYNDKLLYTSYHDRHEPTAIIVEDRDLYMMQKNIFDALWKQGVERTFTFTQAL